MSMIPDLNLYKLTYSGKAKKLSRKNIITNFTLFDIILIYHPKQRRVYIWIGKKASPNLKSHIPRLKQILSEHEPNLVILRNITIESGAETSEFLDLLNISNREMQNHIKALELKLLPQLSEINKLKERADIAFIAEDYEQVINITDKVKKIAKQINDITLEEDQNNLLDEAKSRYSESELIAQITSNAKKVLDEFNLLVKIEYFQEAHRIVKEFKEKYEPNHNLALIPVAQALLVKDNNMKNSLKFKEDIIKKKLDELEALFTNTIKQKDLFKGKDCLSAAKNEIIKILDEDIINKWNKNEEILLALQEEKLKEIYHLSNTAIELIDRREFSNAIKCYQIIVKELKSFH